jgi:hypothetical protein
MIPVGPSACNTWRACGMTMPASRRSGAKRGEGMQHSRADESVAANDTRPDHDRAAARSPRCRHGTILRAVHLAVGFTVVAEAIAP